MEQKTRWIAPWTGLCPVCGKDAILDTRKVSITLWKCKECPSEGRVQTTPTNDTVIYLDNPEHVYKDYPVEKWYGFTIPKEDGSTEDFEVRESHLTQQQENMLVSDAIKYITDFPPIIRKRILHGLNNG
jgi:hypothetical protein